MKAQTTLAPGDILFTSYNGIPAAGIAPDTFSFVVLTPITASTVIYFTERGYQGGPWQAQGTTEGTLTWTCGSALAIGQEVEIFGFTARVNGIANGTVTVAGGNAITGLSLSNAGDQIIAFQGGAGDPTSGAATMISGISWALSCGSTTDVGWNGAGCTYGPQSSIIPPGLTGGTNAFLAGNPGASPNNDHGKFNCTGTPYGTVSALKAAILNKANWLFSSTGLTVMNIPPGCNYYATCVNPTINTQPSNSSVCNGSNTSFTIAATGATAYQWQLNSGSGFSNITNGGIYSNATTTTLNITGVTAGMNGYLYRCIALDGACSTTSSQATLTVSNPSLTASSQTNISCFGGSNGAASVNAASGGISPYSYNWTPGNPTGDGTTFITGLIAGVWTCNVTDNIGCTATINFNITQPSALTLNALSQTNVSCNGGSNGAAQVNPASGGAGGYTYNWTPGNPTGDGTTSVTGLTAGTWTCTVTDANSCTTTRNFTITQPTAISLTALSQTNVACNGGTNGAAQVNPASGGAGGYTYNWTPGNPTGDGTTSVTGLTAGTWTCTVTDANGCTNATNFTITQPTALTLNALSQTNVACNGGSNGAAQVNPATGGAGGYTYNWTPGNPTGDGTTSITGLTAGTWTCTVTDANGCTNATNFTITQPTAITANISSTTTSCSTNNGTATVSSVIGGAGGYTYDWTPGNPTGDGTTSISGLGVGTWTCVITDANGCTISRNVNVSSNSAPTLTALSQTNVACNGGANGAAQVNNASGGTAPYTYNWTPGNPIGDGTTSVSGLTAGTWTCTVSDAGGCTSSVNFTITQPTAISLTALSQTNVSCNGGSNGSAQVNPASGGAGGFGYNWSPGNPTGDGTTSITGLTAGAWTCTVTDANGCTAVSNFTITQPTAITLTALSQTNVSCNGGSNGAAQVNPATGGAGGFTYNWSPGNPSGDGTTSVTGLTAGTWTCTVTDANGCTNAINFTISEPTAISLTSLSQTNVSCNGGSNGLAQVNPATGGASGYIYDWTPGSPSGDGTTSVSGLTAGTWTCTVTDVNGCTVATNFTITQPAVLSSNQTVSICSGDTLSFNGNNYTTPGTYSDTLVSVNGCDSLVITTLTFNTSPTINSLTAIDNSLCIGESTQMTVVATVPTTPYCIPVTSCSFPDVITNVSLGTIANNSGLTCSGSGGYIAYPSTVTTTLTAGVSSPLTVTTGGDTEGAAVWIDYNQNGIFENSEMVLNGYLGSNPAVYNANVTAPLTALNGQTRMRVRCVYNQNPSGIGPCSNTTFGETEDYTITIVGGVDQFVYNWSPSLFLNNTNTETVDVVNPTTTVNYTVNVTYPSTGCSSSSSISIAVNSLPIVNLGSDSTTCDSIITLDGLNSGSSYLWNDGSTNQQLDAVSTGTYFVEVTDPNGCSNSDTVQLVFNSATFSTVNIIECDSFTWNVDGQTYTTSGVYSGVLTNSVGCDSIITLNLTINNSVSSTINATACDSYLWSENGQQYTSSGIYSVTYLTTNGCDSIINLDLTIYNSTSQTTAVIECESFTWPQTGITYTSTGIYSDSLTSIGGCDSILVLDLTITGFPVASATNNGNATITSSTGSTYQWIDCATGLSISGATSQTFAPTINGEYAVVVTNSSGCSDTSNCVLIDNVGFNTNDILELSISPNPTKDKVKIEFNSQLAEIIIRDAQGKLIDYTVINSGEEIQLLKYESGIYFFEIKTQNGSVIERVVKE